MIDKDVVEGRKDPVRVYAKKDKTASSGGDAALTGGDRPAADDGSSMTVWSILPCLAAAHYRGGLWLAILIGLADELAGEASPSLRSSVRSRRKWPAPDFKGISGVTALFLLVVFYRVVESLIMGGVLVLLQRFLKPGLPRSSPAACYGAMAPFPCGRSQLGLHASGGRVPDLSRHCSSSGASTASGLTGSASAAAAHALQNLGRAWCACRLHLVFRCAAQKALPI